MHEGLLWWSTVVVASICTFECGRILPVTETLEVRFLVSTVRGSSIFVVCDGMFGSLEYFLYVQEML